MTALDSSALLAQLLQETGHEHVSAVLPDSCISTVNLAEVLGRMARDGHDPAAVADQIGRSRVEIVPFTIAHAVLVAGLLPLTKPAGLSLGDRACLALAMERGIAAMTADRGWVGLGLPVTIDCIR